LAQVSLLHSGKMVLVWALVAAAFADDETDSAGWKSTTNEQGQRVQQMQVMAPSLTEQDQKDTRLPEQYRCDACMAVAFHLNNRMKRQKVTLASWEYIDLFEATCKEGEFPGYGVKLVDGENALSGPGIQRDESLQPGGASIQMGGDTWGRRLASECTEIVFDIVGEDEVYKLRKAGDFGAALCGKAGYCDNTGIEKAKQGRKAAKAAAEKEKKKKEDEKEKKKAEKQAKIDAGEEDEEEEERREAREAKKRKEKAAKEKKEKEEKKKKEEAEKRKLAAAEAAKTGGKLTWAQYVEGLIERGAVKDDFLFKSRTAKEWDLELLKATNKITSEAVAKSEL